MNQKTCYILGIESSCDETAAAVLNHNKVLSNCITNQEIHEQYGGVVPELASRAHQINIVPVVKHALKEAKINMNQINAIACTQGPGLLGSLLVGNSFAKSLSMSLKIPLIAINHMQAHLMVHFIKDEGITPPDFPFIGVNVSGGHTQIIIVKDYFNMEIIGKTLDDAIGEAFDKCGKKIGLDYPSGPKIDSLSKLGDPKKFIFPIPKVNGLDLSYSGLKTSFINFISTKNEKTPDFAANNINDICSSIQYNLIKNITNKIELAVKKTNIKSVALGGGVSANSSLRNFLIEKKKIENWKVYIPPIPYTTDNAAMIGITGYIKYKRKNFSNLSFKVKSKIEF